jgi:hypothetical protein
MISHRLPWNIQIVWRAVGQRLARKQLCVLYVNLWSQRLIKTSKMMPQRLVNSWNFAH